MRKTMDSIIETLGIIAISLMVLACLWQVFSRYILGSPSGFTEEFMRYALIWTSMIGAPYAFGRGRHISIVAVIKALPPDKRAFVKRLVNICILFFAVVVLIIGGLFVASNAEGQVSAALGMPMQYLYLASPLSGVLFILYLYLEYRDAKEGRSTSTTYRA